MRYGLRNQTHEIFARKNCRAGFVRRRGLRRAGIRAEQPEASGPGLNFEVNPNIVGQPTNLFTYYSGLGSAIGFTNSVGTPSDHADAVGGFFYGLPGGVATNVARVDNFDADYFVNNYVVSNLTVLDDVVVNQSFTFNPLSVGDQQAVDC